MGAARRLVAHRPEANDATVEALIAFLCDEGAATMPHGGGRTLLDHLVGTSVIVSRWAQPAWLQHAALIHSVYGTDGYERQLLPVARRAELSVLAGDRAERLAYLFCTTPRRPLFAGTYRWARDLPTRGDDQPTRDELDALVLLHMANLAEQARAPDGSPGRWLARLGELAELLEDSDNVIRPSFAMQLAGFEEADEALTRRTYRYAMSEEGEARERALALAAAVCPVVAEPCVWLAHLAWLGGDEAAARSWGAEARKRLVALGTTWDKRLEFEQWLALVDAPERAPGDETRAASRARTSADHAIVPPDAEAGRRRFHRYVEGLGDDGVARPGGIYPDLPSRPWHEPHQFSLVGYLESHFAAVRDEILALHDGRFHRESERIGRTGDWDVAFFYERGRRRDEVCAACPLTARGIDTYPTMRTVAGLIYVSRMRPMTHIAPHRGPTNLRVRCHLAIKVPQGDCAIRVGEETRRWEEGRCLVFDDYFEHEAWNQTEDDRIVLIVDLWHPGLSATEVALLEGLQRYVYFSAERLRRYWSANARAAQQTRERNGT